MIRVADQDHLPALIPGFPRNLLDAADMGAGPIPDAAVFLPQTAEGLLPFAVGPDDDDLSRFCLIRTPDQMRAPAAEVRNHLVIVDHRPQHGRQIPLIHGPFRQLHRPAYPIAEPGRLGKNHLHLKSSPSARKSAPSAPRQCPGFPPAWAGGRRSPAGTALR